MVARCCRCGLEISIEANELADWETDGESWCCERCLTPEGEHIIDLQALQMVSEGCLMEEMEQLRPEDFIRKYAQKIPEVVMIELGDGRTKPSRTAPPRTWNSMVVS
jgi:hypothetical protein